MSCQHQTQASCVHQVPVFQQLNAEQSGLISALIRHRIYRKGEMIFREGERSESLFVVRQGLVKISKTSDSGKEQILRFMFPGDFLGQFALLQDKEHYADAEALEATEVCLIRRSDFLSLIESNAKFACRFLIAVSDLLQQADEWIGTISLLEVEQRLAKLLLTFYEKNNRKKLLRLPAPKKELAALLGTTPETLSRKLTQFEQLGLIEVDGAVIALLEPQQLREYAGA